MEANADDSLYLKSTVTYNYPEAEDASYSVESYDQDGNKVTSVYDADTGTLTSVTDSKNISTTYTYNANNDLPLTISRGDQSVSYAYDNFHKLTGIEHEGTTYSLEYDKFANRTKTKVGSRTLAEYEYEANNGYLKSITYGNSTASNPNYVEYTYDRFGNMAEIKYGNTVVAKNFADSSGAIIRTQDLLTNYEHRISYDTTGRLISKELLDLSVTGNADKWLHSLEYNYDVNNNITHFAFADRNRSFVTAYEYGKDNLLENTILPSGKEADYIYDNLGRLTGKNLNTTNAVENTYTYVNSARDTVDGKTYTTTKLATETIAGTKYRYTYDSVGNIKRIYSVASDNTETLLHLYVYDNANQLTADMDTQQGVITDYSYDESGNILQKKVSEWDGNAQIITRGTELSKVNYAYEDTNGWGDLLTSYNGQTITYDAIGNPLSYRDGISLTWQNGRQLASYSQGNTSVNYAYDVSGMRTGKTVVKNGTTTKYTFVYEGGLLRQMSRGSRVYDFIYDANGNPVSIAYRSRSTANPLYYYYGTNYRGDVVSLYDSNGLIVALYEYDDIKKKKDSTERLSFFMVRVTSSKYNRNSLPRILRCAKFWGSSA